jgi:hypothetical protein
MAITKTEKKMTSKTRKQPQVVDKQKKKQDKRMDIKKESRQGKGGGRKAWAPDYGKIENWASNGLFDKQIAALSGITHEEFCRKKSQLPQLNVALEIGRAKGAAACAQMLLSMALKGDRNALEFYLERRAGWKNTTVIETIPKPVGDMTTEELIAIINGQPIK